MGLSDVFDTQAPRSPRQANWLRMVAAIPAVKSVFNDTVTAADVAVAKEAQRLLDNTVRRPSWN